MIFTSLALWVYEQFGTLISRLQALRKQHQERLKQKEKQLRSTQEQEVRAAGGGGRHMSTGARLRMATAMTTNMLAMEKFRWELAEV